MSLSYKSEADRPLLSCGFVVAVFLGPAVSHMQLNRRETFSEASFQLWYSLV